VRRRAGAAGAERSGCRDVLQLVATERTNREIATLFLFPRTVDMHVRNILTRPGSTSRSDAVAKARELGALEG
jgi:DNA-binding CsgD family transcriptional regulator